MSLFLTLHHDAAKTGATPLTILPDHGVTSTAATTAPTVGQEDTDAIVRYDPTANSSDVNTTATRPPSTESVSSQGSTLIAVGEFVSEIFELINDFAFADLVDGGDAEGLGASNAAIKENKSFLGFIGAIRAKPVLVKRTSKPQKVSLGTIAPPPTIDDPHRAKDESKKSIKKKKHDEKKERKKKQRGKDAPAVQSAESSGKENKRASSGTEGRRSKVKEQGLQRYEPEYDDVVFHAPMEVEDKEGALEDDTWALKDNESRDEEAVDEDPQEGAVTDATTGSSHTWASKDNEARDEEALDDDSQGAVKDMTTANRRHKGYQFIAPSNPYKQSEASTRDDRVSIKKLIAAFDGGKGGVNKVVPKTKMEPRAPLSTVTSRRPRPSSPSGGDFSHPIEIRDDESDEGDSTTQASKNTYVDDDTAGDSIIYYASYTVPDGSTATSNTDDDSDKATKRAVRKDSDEDSSYDQFLYSADDSEQRDVDTRETQGGRKKSEVMNPTSDHVNDAWTSGTAGEEDSVETTDRRKRTSTKREVRNEHVMMHRSGDDSQRDDVEEEDNKSKHDSLPIGSDGFTFHSLNPPRQAVIPKYNKQWPPSQFPEGRYESFNAEVKTRHIESTVHLEATVPKNSHIRENRKRLARHWAMRIKHQARAKQGPLQSELIPQDDLLDVRGGH